MNLHPTYQPARERVVFDGGALAMERGREWAEALGVELVTSRRWPARRAAQLVVVEAAAGRIRWRVRHSVSPILIARPRSPVGGMLVVIDFDEAPLELAARLAQKRHDPVTLLRSIEPGIHAAEWMANFGGSTWDFVPNDAAARHKAAVAGLVELLARYELQGDAIVGERATAPFILEVAGRLRPDLLVIGASRGLLHLLRPTIADEIAASAPGSVLVVPHRPHLSVGA